MNNLINIISSLLAVMYCCSFAYSQDITTIEDSHLQTSEIEYYKFNYTINNTAPDGIQIVINVTSISGITPLEFVLEQNSLPQMTVQGGVDTSKIQTAEIQFTGSTFQGLIQINQSQNQSDLQNCTIIVQAPQDSHNAYVDFTQSIGQVPLSDPPNQNIKAEQTLQLDGELSIHDPLKIEEKYIRPIRLDFTDTIVLDKLSIKQQQMNTKFANSVNSIQFSNPSTTNCNVYLFATLVNNSKKYCVSPIQNTVHQLINGDSTNQNIALIVSQNDIVHVTMALVTTCREPVSLIQFTSSGSQEAQSGSHTQIIVICCVLPTLIAMLLVIFMIRRRIKAKTVAKIAVRRRKAKSLTMNDATYTLAIKRRNDMAGFSNIARKQISKLTQTKNKKLQFNSNNQTYLNFQIPINHGQNTAAAISKEQEYELTQQYTDNILKTNFNSQQRLHYPEEVNERHLNNEYDLRKQSTEGNEECIASLRHVPHLAVTANNFKFLSSLQNIQNQAGTDRRGLGPSHNASSFTSVRCESEGTKQNLGFGEVQNVSDSSFGLQISQNDSISQSISVRMGERHLNLRSAGLFSSFNLNRRQTSIKSVSSAELMSVNLKKRQDHIGSFDNNNEDADSSPNKLLFRSSTRRLRNSNIQTNLELSLQDMDACQSGRQLRHHYSHASSMKQQNRDDNFLTDGNPLREYSSQRENIIIRNNNPLRNNNYLDVYNRSKQSDLSPTSNNINSEEYSQNSENWRSEASPKNEHTSTSTRAPITKQKDLVNSELGTKSDTCVICLSNFYNHEEVRVLLCMHVFHSLCVSEWIENHESCPCCREVAVNEVQNTHRSQRSSPMSTAQVN